MNMGTKEADNSGWFLPTDGSVTFKIGTVAICKKN